MNTVKIYLLLMCLCIIVGAQAMTREIGNLSLITSHSRSQSPLSPTSPMSPSYCRSSQSTKTEPAEVVAYLAMIEAKRVKIEQSIDEKNFQLRMIQRSTWLDADGESVGMSRVSSAKILKEIEVLRKQLPQ